MLIVKAEDCPRVHVNAAVWTEPLPNIADVMCCGLNDSMLFEILLAEKTKLLVTKSNMESFCTKLKTLNRRGTQGCWLRWLKGFNLWDMDTTSWMFIHVCSCNGMALYHPDLPLLPVMRRALGPLGNFKTGEKNLQNQKTDEKRQQNQKPHTNLTKPLHFHF